MILMGNLLKMADFGLSKPIKSLMNHTVELGTSTYMAPETILNPPLIDPTLSDVWAAGVTFYRLIYKRQPWMSSLNYSDFNY